MRDGRKRIYYQSCLQKVTHQILLCYPEIPVDSLQELTNTSKQKVKSPAHFMSSHRSLASSVRLQQKLAAETARKRTTSEKCQSVDSLDDGGLYEWS